MECTSYQKKQTTYKQCVARSNLHGPGARGCNEWFLGAVCPYVDNAGAHGSSSTSKLVVFKQMSS